MFDNEDKHIYIISNKHGGKLGFYIKKINMMNPFADRGENKGFIVNWNRNLDIGDASIFILRDQAKGYKEIVVSYKTIFINVYNILVLDQRHRSGQALMYRHESFQLWESQISGTLIHATNDFVTINRDGVMIFALGSISKRPIQDSVGDMRMIHSLESMSYLKLDQTNLLVFANQKMEKREVQIQQVSNNKDKDNET